MPENQDNEEHLRLEFRLPTWLGVPAIEGKSPISVCGVSIRDLSAEGGRLGDFVVEYEGQNSLEQTHAVADRADRFEPRVKKQRPNHYGWLTRPRAEFKRDMAKGVIKI